MKQAATRLTWRFALLPALAVVALTVVMLVCGYGLLGAELTRRALASHQQRADLLSLQLQLSLSDAVGQVQSLARSPLLRPGVPPDRIRAELDDLVARSPRFVWVGLVAPDGRVLSASRGWLEGQGIAHRPVFARGRRGMMGDVHPAVSLAPLLNQLQDNTTELIDIGEPVRDEDGKLVAVVCAHLGLQWVSEQLALSLGAPEAAAQSGMQGLVLTTSPVERSVVPGTVPPPRLPSDIQQAQVWLGDDGSRRLLAQSQVRDPRLLPWRTVVLQDEAQALAPLRAFGATMLWIGIGTALLLGGAGFWATRRLLLPWDPLFDAALAGQDGDAAAVAARVQTLVAARAQPTPTEKLLGWLARDAGNLRRALDHLPVAIALADRDLRCEHVNPAYTRLLGWTPDTARGRLVGEPLLDAPGREAWARLLQRWQAEPGEFVSRLEALSPTGAAVAVQQHLVPMFDARGGLVGALAVVHDIRAERCARLHAQALDERLRALADAAPDTLLALLDVDGRVLEWSPGAEQISGHAVPQALGQTLDALLPGAEAARDWLRSTHLDGRCALLLQQGDRLLTGSLYRLGPASGAACFGVMLRPGGLSGSASSREVLTLLNRRLLEQEKESARKLARCLHDELGQSLAALRLHWEAFRGADADARERMEPRIASLVVLANRQLRGVLGDLRPPLLDELGLAAALDNEIRQHGGDGSVRVELQAGETAQLQRWPADIEYAAFMIGREALLNALRHSRARVIRVSLDGDEGLLELVVSDDGVGLPAEGRDDPANQLGIIGMRERALTIGASLYVDGRAGDGTMVALTWMP
ncbi:PAS domain-containing protein [Roseateles asaccharophilus]|uniref:histidine kinase n=1 Tax=Roseateles asaccharophilus TaxID=582607 RepID=A0ABU2A7X3_9BURK|nr:PAS domain-containing protein [Roseateles asaccharophilus]MDR7333296.1 PAS domain S-box-containing protein [Roseateles asaccharophilus]